MNFVGTSIDHSKLEDISYNGNQSDEDDEVYLSGDEKDADEDEVRDCFPNETVVANKRCKIYPKSRHYAIVRFGAGYSDKAIALPKVICYDDDVIDGGRMMSDISWGHDGWINARRDMLSPIKWKVTLLWTGTRKPAGLNNNAHHNDEQWRQLLQEYQDLGDVDASMRRVSVPTLKSLANDLNASDKFFDIRENGTSGCDIGVYSNSREFSNMLEDIDERQSETNTRCADTSRKLPFVTVCEGLQKVAVVEKVERDRLIFMPLHYKESKFQGIYSLSVSKKKVVIQGERAEKLDLKSIVCPGESFNIKCDLMYDEETKEKFGDVKEAWNGKVRNINSVSYPTEPKGKSINTGSLPDNKSLEPIDATDANNSADNFQFIKYIGGKLKVVTQSFICVEPVKKEYQDKEPFPLFCNNFYFANGTTGDAYEDLRESDLKVGDYLKMNAAIIDGKLMVISAWEPGAKPPKGDEIKAAEIAKEIKKKNQKPVSIATHGKLEEPTPESQMSARPHSPSHFRLNAPTLRRPKTATLVDCKPAQLRIPEKLPLSLASFQSSDCSAEISSKKVTKGIISSSKTNNLSRPKSVSYQEPLSPSSISMPQCSAFTNKETKTLNYTELNNELDNKTVSFSDRSNPQAVLNIIERCFQKSIEKMKPSFNSSEGANAYRTKSLAITKQMFVESLNKELQMSNICAEQAWSSFENFINHFHVFGNEMKGDFSYPNSKSFKCNISATPVPTAHVSTQTMIIGPVYSCELLIETPPERQWK